MINEIEEYLIDRNSQADILFMWKRECRNLEILKIIKKVIILINYRFEF